jgi:hypothetical protein
LYCYDEESAFQHPFEGHNGSVNRTEPSHVFLLRHDISLIRTELESQAQPLLYSAASHCRLSKSAVSIIQLARIDLPLQLNQ